MRRSVSRMYIISGFFSNITVCVLHSVRISSPFHHFWFYTKLYSIQQLTFRYLHISSTMNAAANYNIHTYCLHTLKWSNTALFFWVTETFLFWYVIYHYFASPFISVFPSLIWLLTIWLELSHLASAAVCFWTKAARMTNNTKFFKAIL